MYVTKLQHVTDIRGKKVLFHSLRTSVSLVGAASESVGWFSTSTFVANMFDVAGKTELRYLLGCIIINLTALVLSNKL
jgi:hypothetical protein